LHLLLSGQDLQKKQQEQQAISATTVDATPQETTVAAA
jgi:hypothetical protein